MTEREPLLDNHLKCTTGSEEQREGRKYNNDIKSPLLNNHVQYTPESQESDTLKQQGYPSDDVSPSAEGGQHQGEGTTAVYGTRWYALFVMSVCIALRYTTWGTWGPIAQSAKAVYGWSTSILGLMIDCGNAGIFTCLIPAGFIVNKKGLRVSILITAFCLTLSPALRAITFRQNASNILIGLGQYMAGVSGSFTQVTVNLVSETWFPSNERTTATTISLLSSALGSSAAFIMGPWLVSQPLYNETVRNASRTLGNGTMILINKQNMEYEIRRLNIIEFGCGATLLLMTFVYFPKKPPKPPTISASVKRQGFKQGFSKLIRNVNIWRVNVPCSIAFAVFVNWLSLLDVNLHHLGISQRQAGWFGLYAFVAGSVGGTIIGRIANRYQRQLKLIQILLMGGGASITAWITCMRNQYIVHSNVLFGVAVASLGVLMFASFPLNMEFACEIGYPVSAEVVGMFLGLNLSAVVIAFLLILLIPGVGIGWINWALVGILALPVVFLSTFRVKYNRLDVDTEVDVTVNSLPHDKHGHTARASDT